MIFHFFCYIIFPYGKNITEIIAGLHLVGAHKAGDEFWSAYNTAAAAHQLPPKLLDETLLKVRSMGKLTMLTNDQLREATEFIPRGIGTNKIDCFACGKHAESGFQHDMSAFVKDRGEGARSVRMFESVDSSAVLDYRNGEPNYVQVKVGACDDHKLNLEKLMILANVNGRHIHPALIESARNFVPQRK